MKSIYIDNTILTQDKKFTFLSGDATAALATLQVRSIVGISTAKILLIGGLNDEESEIKLAHSSTDPSGTTVTLASNLTFSHPQDTRVYVIDWDCADFSHADTLTGTKSSLSGTIALQIDQLETLYDDTAETSGFYFTRFYNSARDAYSGYSDPVPYAGYADNTVSAIKERALESTDEEISDEITHDFLNKALWQARREYHDADGKRPFRMRFNYPMGVITTGMWKIEAPVDLEAANTGENVFGLRIGTERNMSYQGKKEHDSDYQGVAHSTLAADYAITDGTFQLADVRDFESDGSVNIENDTIAYSARNVTTEVMTVDTAGDEAHGSGVDVWQGGGYGLPSNFTVFIDASSGSNYIYFNRPVETSYIDQNIYIDYYRTLVPYDSDSDVLDEPNYDMYVPYLAWRIKKKKNKGLQPLEDPDFQEWIMKKASALKTEYLGQDIRIMPDIAPLPY